MEDEVAKFAKFPSSRDHDLMISTVVEFLEACQGFETKSFEILSWFFARLLKFCWICGGCHGEILIRRFYKTSESCGFQNNKNLHGSGGLRNGLKLEVNKQGSLTGAMW